MMSPSEVCSRVSGRDVVEAWILEYACVMKYSAVLKEVISSRKSPFKLAVQRLCPNATLHLALFSLHDIISNNCVSDLDMAVTLIDEIFNQSGSNVALKLYVRLVFGLKVLSVYHTLRTEDPVIALENLNKYFPRTDFKHPGATPEFSQSITKKMAHFRAKFLQVAMSTGKKKKEFFAHTYEKDYGEVFVSAVRKLCNDFCRGLQPSTSVVNEILNSPVESKLISDLRAEQCFEINVVLNACEVQRSQLAEDEVLGLFHQIQFT